MRGVVYIERENTDGDRRTIRTLDVEGFSVTLGDPMGIVKQAVRDALIDPEDAAYTVRAIHDDGWSTRVVHRESYGDRAWIERSA
jgi:hypothetical protein